MLLLQLTCLSFMSNIYPYYHMSWTRDWFYCQLILWYTWQNVFHRVVDVRFCEINWSEWSACAALGCWHKRMFRYICLLFFFLNTAIKTHIRGCHRVSHFCMGTIFYILPDFARKWTRKTFWKLYPPIPEFLVWPSPPLD